MEESGDVNRSPLLGAAGLRPLGAVGVWQIGGEAASSAGSEPSNHEVTERRRGWGATLTTKTTASRDPCQVPCREAKVQDYHAMLEVVLSDLRNLQKRGGFKWDLTLSWHLQVCP